MREVDGARHERGMLTGYKGGGNLTLPVVVKLKHIVMTSER